MMDQAAKAKFILALHKHSLEAFDGGGIVGSIGNVLGLENNFQGQSAGLQPGTNVGQLDNAYERAQLGLQAQRNFAANAGSQNGFGNQANVFAQQQALANQLQSQANGEGPNPAQAALNQATGQNVANQAALMASQRGAGSNAGLIARQAAQQGAATQQQAVGQSATLQAQQQLAAQAALASQQAQLQNVAGNQINTSGTATNNYNNSELGEQSILQGANTAYNNASVANQSNLNNVNSQTAQGNQKTNSDLFGTLFGAGKSALGNIGGAIGGLFYEGGDVHFPDHLNMVAKIYHPHMFSDVDSFRSGGKVEAKEPMEKADKKGDAKSNDKIPALLSEGEIVIPRRIAMGPKAPEKAAAFVQAVINKRKMGKK